VLGEGGRVEHQHGVRFAQLRPDLAGQFGKQGAVVPGGLADELLEGLAVLVVVVRDRLGVLAAEAGQEPLGVPPGVVPLLPAGQVSDERFEERTEAGEEATEEVRVELRGRLQFLPAEFVPAVHRLPSQARCPWESLLPDVLTTSNYPTQYS
jgi:hypothetical protein